MSEPLDVALRIKLNYAAGGADRAVADVEKLRAKVTQLGMVAGADKLGRDLAGAAAPAQAITGKLTDLTAVANKPAPRRRRRLGARPRQGRGRDRPQNRGKRPVGRQQGRSAGHAYHLAGFVTGLKVDAQGNRLKRPAG